MIAVVDYGMGNVRSVLNALEALGGRAVLASTGSELDEAQRIVLPGVGAFREAMDRLHDRALIESLRRNVVECGKPFLGVCLGMQLLADVSFEHGEHRGLGWISGEVRRIEPADPALRVPHIGWNDVERRGTSRLLCERAAFYFVHAFHLVPQDPQVVTGTCDYGGPITAVVERGNILGTQFHPEKSQQAGLKLLGTFLEM
jgi:imidazole glycerol-phosphate synthase subunit HisH